MPSRRIAKHHADRFMAVMILKESDGSRFKPNCDCLGLLASLPRRDTFANSVGTRRSQAER
jgi:hypothetical protein